MDVEDTNGYVVISTEEDNENKSYDKIAVSLMNKYKESEYYRM